MKRCSRLALSVCAIVLGGAVVALAPAACHGGVVAHIGPSAPSHQNLVAEVDYLGHQYYQKYGYEYACPEEQYDYQYEDGYDSEAVEPEDETPAQRAETSAETPHTSPSADDEEYDFEYSYEEYLLKYRYAEGKPADGAADSSDNAADEPAEEEESEDSDDEADEYMMPEPWYDYSEPDAEPETAEPETTEPEAAEPEAAEPKAAEPKAAEPKAAEPKATEPKATEPKATEPEAAEPKATEPKATEPKATEPKATEPEATEPEATGASDVNAYEYTYPGEQYGYSKAMAGYPEVEDGAGTCFDHGDVLEEEVRDHPYSGMHEYYGGQIMEGAETDAEGYDNNANQERPDYDEERFYYDEQRPDYEEEPSHDPEQNLYEGVEPAEPFAANRVSTGGATLGAFLTLAADGLDSLGAALANVSRHLRSLR